MAKPTASVDNFDLYRPPAQVCFTKELLQSLFCLPLKEAAMATRVSVTTFKRMCRKHGVKAWPFRFQAALTRARSPISPTHLPSVVSSIKEANPVIMITSTVSAQVPHSDVQTQAHKIQAHICLDMANMMSVDSELEHSRAFSIPPTTEGRDAPASPANDGFEIVQHQDSSRKQTMQIAFEAFDELLPTLSSAADGFGSSLAHPLCTVESGSAELFPSHHFDLSESTLPLSCNSRTSSALAELIRDVIAVEYYL
eukprot:2447906-Rhodomonas_salina.1